MLKGKFIRIFWIVLLVLSAFILGYTLKPTSERPRPFAAAMGTGRPFAPPLNFGGRR